MLESYDKESESDGVRTVQLFPQQASLLVKREYLIRWRVSWGCFWLAHFSINTVFTSEFPLIYSFQNTSKLLLFSSHLMKCSAVLHVPLCPVLWWNYHAGDGRFSQQIISNRLHCPRRKSILDVPSLHLHQSFRGSGMWMLLTNMVLQGTYRH